MLFRGLARIPIVAAVSLMCVGCNEGISNSWWNAFLDPTQLGNFRENTVSDIQRSISFRDTPLGVVGAEDPKPGDLVADVEEYQIGPGDTLQIGLLDFVMLGAETTLTPTVDELGSINIPQIGQVQADGRTARELQSDLIQKAKAQGIYNPDDNPTVTVTVANPMQRMYNLSGSVLYAGPYRIPRPDFRLREAINLGGGMDDSVKYVWVVRNSLRRKRVQERPASPVSPPPPAAPDTTSGQSAPPVSPVLMSDMQTSTGSPAKSPSTSPNGATRPATSGNLALPADEVPGELIEAIRPHQTVAQTQPKPQAKSVSTAPVAAGKAVSSAPTAGSPQRTASDLPSYKFVNNAFIEVPAQPAQMQPQPSATQKEPAAQSVAASQPIDWDQLAGEVEQRIIRVPADKLRNGDPNYNIVIKHDDWVRVDPGPVGVYYMDGHFVRPGPYSLSGEQITLKQAMAAAGGLDQLAWPTRCEVCRRLDADREEVTQWDLSRIVEGKDPDLYLKPNDVIRVGTHAIAPLLATIRNSFRFTYGFGFVYDRNFADLDSFGAQQNPTDRHRIERQQRFGNLFSN